MKFEKFTLKVQEALGSAQQLAEQYGQQGIDVEHLFLAMLQTAGGDRGADPEKAGRGSQARSKPRSSMPSSADAEGFRDAGPGRSISRRG